MKRLVDFFTFHLLGFSHESAMGHTLNFFIYDSMKLLFLLVAMIYVLSFLRTYIPEDKLKKYLGGNNKVLAAFLAAIFGAITPFCTCSSIPIFISLFKLRLPVAALFSFLITSPLVNQYVVAIMPGMIGIKITLIYVVLGVAMGVAGGLLLDKLGVQKHFEMDFAPEGEQILPEIKTTKDRNNFAISEAKDIVKKLWKWLLLGVGIGAIIHNLIPKESIEYLTELTKPFDVIIITLIAIPMYGSCIAVIPIAIALFKKGVALGTAFAFMMSFSGLSFPEAVILRRVMNLKLIGMFFGIVFLGIITIGYILNFLQPYITNH